MGIVDSEGKYNYDVATTPLLNTVNETDPSIHNEKWIVEIQTKAIKKCGVDPGRKLFLRTIFPIIELDFVIVQHFQFQNDSNW